MKPGPFVLAALILAAVRPLAGQNVPVAPAPIVLSLAPGTSSLEHEGAIRAGQPIELVLTPVPGEVLETHLEAKEGEIEMSVYRDGADAPESGTEPGSGAIGWISAGAGAQRLRFVVRAQAVETRYRLTVEVRAPDPPAAE